MRTIVEVETMLVSELIDNLNKVDPNERLEYYNSILRDSSFLLAGLLDQLMKTDDSWPTDRWIDDSLLTMVRAGDKKISIWGIIIWGSDNTTEQWTDPFYFEIIQENEELLFTSYTFLFCDLNVPEITYEDFNYSRGVWDRQFYSSDEWMPSERDWKYIIIRKKE